MVRKINGDGEGSGRHKCNRGDEDGSGGLSTEESTGLSILHCKI